MQMGRPDDKAGRQLGVFMDLSELEQNREKYKAIKEQRQAVSAGGRKRSGEHTDWSKLKGDKKAEKKKKTNAWLQED
jgi:hypothetical protein